MPDDDELGADPGKTENRSHPDAKGGPDIFREGGRKSTDLEKGSREQHERPPEDKDDD